MGSRLHGNDGRPRVPTVIPINPELHISVIPAQEDPCTTVIPANNRHSREGGNPGVEGMGSRLHGNDGRPRVPTVIPTKPQLRISVIPAQEDPCTTVIPAKAGTRGGGDGFPSPRERRAAARPYRHSYQTRTPHFRHSRAGRPLHNRHSRDGGNPGVAGMGSRLHGNDGRHPVSATIPPPRREHTAHAPPHPCRGPCTTVIPAAYPSFPLHNRHSRECGNPGVEGMGSRLHGNDGRRRTPSPPQVHLHAASISYRRYENWKA